MGSKASLQFAVVQCGAAEWRVKAIEGLSQNASYHDAEKAAKRAVCVRGGSCGRSFIFYLAKVMLRSSWLLICRGLDRHSNGLSLTNYQLIIRNAQQAAGEKLHGRHAP